MRRKLIACIMVAAMTSTLAPLPVLAEEQGAENISTAATAVSSGSTEQTETSVAKVGDQYYDSLSEAFKAIITEGTVELLADVTLTNKIDVYSGKTIVLDLGRSTIQAGGDFWNSNTMFRVRGSLTVQGAGTINAATEGNTGLQYAILADQGGTVQVRSGSIVGNACGIYIQKGTATLSGGQISNTKAGTGAIESGALVVGPNNMATLSGDVQLTGFDYAAVAVGGTLMLSEQAALSGPFGLVLLNSPQENSTSATHSSLTMTGGTVTATSGFALSGNNLKSAGCTATVTGGQLQQTSGETCIYWPMEGTLSVGGNANVQGGSGIEARMGTITISDQATITGTGSYLTSAPTSGASQADGSAILVSGQMYGNGEGQYASDPDLKLQINGGTLNSTNGSALTLYNTKSIDEQNVTVDVTAGALNAADDKASIQAVNMNNASLTDGGNVTATESKSTLTVSPAVAGAAVDQGENVALYANVNDALATLSIATAESPAKVLVIDDANVDGSVLTNEHITLVTPSTVTLWITTDQKDKAVQATTDEQGNIIYQLVDAATNDAPATPTVTLTADKTQAYHGDTIVLTASVADADPAASYAYTLYRDGQAVERATSSHFSVTTNGTYTVGVTASKTTETGTLSSSEALSAPVQCTFVNEPPYTGKYSYEIVSDVGENGTIDVDRYATEGDKVTITVSPDEAYLLDDLTVTSGGKDVELTDNGDGTYTFTMPSGDVEITATFVEDPNWEEPEDPSTDVSEIFTDVPANHWAKAAIQYAYDNGLMTGVSDTEFAPEATTTRAMIVSILARLENVTSAEAAGFADVSADDWYATAVNWAASAGVVSGTGDGNFSPNAAITREQLAAMLMNYSAWKGEDVSARADLSAYSDQPSTWAAETMQWAVAEGLISGVTADQLQPQGNATRAQVAAILQRFLCK